MIVGQEVVQLDANDRTWNITKENGERFKQEVTNSSPVRVPDERVKKGLDLLRLHRYRDPLAC